MDEDFKKYISRGVMVLMTCVAVYTFYTSYSYKKQTDDMVLVTEKRIGDFKITAFHGPTPFTVDMINLASAEELKDVFISGSCPKFAKNLRGTVVAMLRVNNFKIKTGEQYYTYEGAYDTLCTNKKP